MVAVAAWWLLGLDLTVAALLGAVLVVTGPTVVGPILRQIRPKRRVGSIIKWEGIVIDPIGAVLAVLVFEVVFAEAGQAGVGHALWLLAKTIAIGAGVGAATAWLIVEVMRRYWLPDYLHGVAVLAAALAAFTISNWMQHESGLVTVTVLGILLANQRRVSIRHVVEFKEHLGVFLISCLFIVLGSRLDPRELWNLGWSGTAFVAAIILLVRPASVFLAMLGDSTRFHERAFLAFLAPRGIVAAAVSSVFALQLSVSIALRGDSPELLGQVERLVPVTFLVIVSTVACYGLLAGPLARWLGLADPNPQGILFAGADPWVRAVAASLKDAGFQVMLIDTNFSHVAEARMQGVPAECASVLSEYVQEEMDLGGIGRLLAVTPNEEVNALAVREMAHVFGRRNVYQVAPDNKASGRRQSMGEHLRGRLLFQSGLTSEVLQRLLAEGAIFKKTTLTDEFTFADFQEMYGPATVVMFIIDRHETLHICVADEAPEAESGDTLLALVTDANSAAPHPRES